MHALERLALDEWGYDDELVQAAFKQFLQQRHSTAASLKVNEETASAFSDVLRSLVPDEHVDFTDDDEEAAGKPDCKGILHCL